jgi:hypothetical protein
LPVVTSFQKGHNRSRNGTRQTANRMTFVHRLPRIWPRSLFKTDL